MILHLVKCEMCDNQFSFSQFERPHERAAPETWFTLFKSRDMQAQEGWNFCGVACLNQWTIKGHPELPSAHLAKVGEQGPNERAYFEAQKLGKQS